MCVCVCFAAFDLHVVFRCLRGYPITSSTWCGQFLRSVCGRRGKRGEGRGELCLYFLHGCICSLSSSEGLTQGNNIVKIVLRSPLRHAEHFAFFFFLLSSLGGMRLRLGLKLHVIACF